MWTYYLANSFGVDFVEFAPAMVRSCIAMKFLFTRRASPGIDRSVLPNPASGPTIRHQKKPFPSRPGNGYLFASTWRYLLMSELLFAVSQCHFDLILEHLSGDGEFVAAASSGPFGLFV